MEKGSRMQMTRNTEISGNNHSNGETSCSQIYSSRGINWYYQIWSIILVVYMSSGTNWEKGECEIDGLGVVASEKCSWLCTKHRIC